MTGTVSEPRGLPSPAQLARAAEDAAYDKAIGRSLTSFLLGLTGGAYIALGFVFSTTTHVGAEALPWGVAKVLGGVVFSTGLVLVVLTGAELFTSSTPTLTARASGRISWAQLLRDWGVVYAGNRLLGAHDDRQGPRTHMPIALFVSTGFEHSVANMFLLPLGLLVKHTAGGEFWAAAGVVPSDYAALTWDAFLVGNLLPVTVGNVVGGGVMIGLMYWTIFHRPADR